MAKKKTRAKTKKVAAKKIGTPRQLAFITLLRDCVNKDRPTSIDEIVERTGWKHSTTRTYLSEGHLAQLLIQRDGRICVRPEAGSLSDEELIRRMSQSSKVRLVSPVMNEPLACELAKHSKENMILAIELYNRPSLENRVGAFSVLFCMAWEQILKSVIIERDGESAIFSGNSRHGHRETYSLRDCVSTIFKKKNMIAENIYSITNLRDLAVHLLVPELQAAASRMFQSGVLNYQEFYYRATGRKLFHSSSRGLLSIVNDLGEGDSSLVVKYGKSVGDEIEKLNDVLKKAINDHDDNSFAIPLNYTVQFVKSNETPDLEVATGKGGGLRGTVIQKIVSDYNTWKHKTSEATEKVNRRLRDTLKNDMKDHGVTDSNGNLRFTTGHFLAIALKEGWKNSNNKYHKQYPQHNNSRLYTDAAIDHIVQKITDDKQYLNRAMDFTKRNRLGRR